MRIMMTLGMLAAMASAALAQEPNRNRMNDQIPDVKIEDPQGRPPEGSGLPSPYGNRMNIQYGKVSSAELTWDRNPNENRMNFQVPKSTPNPRPKPLEQPKPDPARRP